jgi:hypothetical protein
MQVLETLRRVVTIQIEIAVQIVVSLAISQADKPTWIDLLKYVPGTRAWVPALTPSNCGMRFAQFRTHTFLHVSRRRVFSCGAAEAMYARHCACMRLEITSISSRGSLRPLKHVPLTDVHKRKRRCSAVRGDRPRMKRSSTIGLHWRLSCVKFVRVASIGAGHCTAASVALESSRCCRDAGRRSLQVIGNVRASVRLVRACR